MGSPERLFLKEVAGPKISWQKTSRFLRSVQDDPDTLREFILLFYALGKEEFENKYKKLWLSIQKHLKGKIYPILWLEEKKTEEIKKIELQKEGVKIFLYYLARCYHKGIFEKQTAYTVIKTFSKILRTQYPTSTLYRRFTEQIEKLKEQTGDKEKFKE
ncbi:MAG: hypothetical protein LUG96_06160 [Tannerellaceae bacterium]|nr:hypothetical protein [Tannerellaceae bacterium]